MQVSTFRIIVMVSYRNRAGQMVVKIKGYFSAI